MKTKPKYNILDIVEYNVKDSVHKQILGDICSGRIYGIEAHLLCGQYMFWYDIGTNLDDESFRVSVYEGDINVVVGE